MKSSFISIGRQHKTTPSPTIADSQDVTETQMTRLNSKENVASPESIPIQKSSISLVSEPEPSEPALPTSTPPPSIPIVQSATPCQKSAEAQKDARTARSRPIKNIVPAHGSSVAKSLSRPTVKSGDKAEDKSAVTNGNHVSMAFPSPSYRGDQNERTPTKIRPNVKAQTSAKKVLPSTNKQEAATKAIGTPIQAGTPKTSDRTSTPVTASITPVRPTSGTKTGNFARPTSSSKARSNGSLQTKHTSPLSNKRLVDRGTGARTVSGASKIVSTQNAPAEAKGAGTKQAGDVYNVQSKSLERALSLSQAPIQPAWTETALSENRSAL